MNDSLFNAELRHDWDDYDPVDLYGAEWDNHAVREWD